MEAPDWPPRLALWAISDHSVQKRTLPFPARPYMLQAFCLGKRFYGWDSWFFILQPFSSSPVGQKFTSLVITGVKAFKRKLKFFYRLHWFFDPSQVIFLQVLSCLLLVCFLYFIALFLLLHRALSFWFCLVFRPDFFSAVFSGPMTAQAFYSAVCSVSHL